MYVWRTLFPRMQIWKREPVVDQNSGERFLSLHRGWGEPSCCFLPCNHFSWVMDERGLQGMPKTSYWFQSSVYGVLQLWTELSPARQYPHCSWFLSILLNYNLCRCSLTWLPQNKPQHSFPLYLSFLFEFPLVFVLPKPRYLHHSSTPLYFLFHCSAASPSL